MKKTLFCLLLLATGCEYFGVKDLRPILGKHINMNPADEREFNRLKLTGIEFPEGKEDYWDILGIGCNFYCGTERAKPTATSALAPKNGETFGAENLHDDSYRTAWAENAEGYGMGESITYTFAPGHPRITQIIVLNGYLKSDKDWQDYSRAKTLKMYINDKPYAVLHLKDSKQEQIFDVDTIGCANRTDKAAMAEQPPTVLRFELGEHYPGRVHAATALTEIYFNGVDVH